MLLFGGLHEVVYSHDILLCFWVSNLNPSGHKRIDWSWLYISVGLCKLSGWDLKTSSRGVVYIWFVSHFRTDNKPFWPPCLNQQMRLWYHVKFELIMDFYLKPIDYKQNDPSHICLKFRYEISTRPLDMMVLSAHLKLNLTLIPIINPFVPLNLGQKWVSDIMYD